MKKELTNVELSFQCHENWNDLKQDGNGRMCDKCKHKVYDFRKSTKEDYERVVKESNGKVCGLFKTSQTNNNFMLYAAASTMLIAGIIPVACSPEIRPVIEQPLEQIEELEVVYVTMGVPVIPDSIDTVLYRLPEVVDSTTNDMGLIKNNLDSTIVKNDSTSR